MIADETVRKSAFGIVALVAISIILVATVHCGAAQSSTNEIANSNPIVTASAGVGGTISPNGVFSLSYGGSQVFTVAPDKGYIINQVLMNRTSALRDGIILNNPYSFTVQNVTGTTTISATFTLFASSSPPSTDTGVSNNLSLTNQIIAVVLVLSLLAVAILTKRKRNKEG